MFTNSLKSKIEIRKSSRKRLSMHEGIILMFDLIFTSGVRSLRLAPTPIQLTFSCPTRVVPMKQEHSATGRPALSFFEDKYLRLPRSGHKSFFGHFYFCSLNFERFTSFIVHAKWQCNQLKQVRNAQRNECIHLERGITNTYIQSSA